jgi:hypothetical protein
MALAALGRNEAHKFFGGREDINDGKRTARFSEDNSGQTPEETARLNRQAKMLNKFLNDYEIRKTQEADREWEEGEKEWNKAKAEGRVPGETISTGGMNQPMDLADFPDDEDTDKQSSSAELENARKLAQMYANRMGRRYSKVPTPTPVAPKDKEIILDKTANNMDQNNLDRWFMRLYGVDKFNTIPTKQRNAMLWQYNQSKVKR